jgi:hypothetical protein
VRSIPSTIDILSIKIGTLAVLSRESRFAHPVSAPHKRATGRYSVGLLSISKTVCEWSRFDVEVLYNESTDVDHS